MISAAYPRPLAEFLCIQDSVSVRRLGETRPILDLLSQRFMLKILATIGEEELRFNALQRKVDVSGNTLRLRLAELEVAGLLRRKVQSQLPPCVSFRLTPKGRDLLPILALIESWELKWPANTRDSSMEQQIAAESISPYKP